MLRQLLHEKRLPSLCNRPNNIHMEEKNRRDALLAAILFARRAAKAAREAPPPQPLRSPGPHPPRPIAGPHAPYMRPGLAATFLWAQFVRNKPPDTPTRRAPDPPSKRPSLPGCGTGAGGLAAEGVVRAGCFSVAAPERAAAEPFTSCW